MSVIDDQFGLDLVVEVILLFVLLAFGVYYVSKHTTIFDTPTQATATSTLPIAH